MGFNSAFKVSFSLPVTSNQLPAPVVDRSMQHATDIFDRG